MVLWNLTTLAFVVAFAHFGQLKAPQPGFGLQPLLREILHLQAPGEINVQNAFLRDVFVCMMIAPLLVRLPSLPLGAMLAGDTSEEGRVGKESVSTCRSRWWP